MELKQKLFSEFSGPLAVWEDGEGEIIRPGVAYVWKVGSCKSYVLQTLRESLRVLSKSTPSSHLHCLCLWAVM